MAGKTLRTVMLAGLIVAVPVAGVVFAHGGGSADQNQAYGSAGGMGSGMMGNQGTGAGMMGSQGMGPGMMGSQGMGHGMMGSQGMGPGLMGGQDMGSGMMGGQGMGPGMMGGQGMGPGMMGGQGMGPGMMGDQGMGPGMMGGQGMGPGMMGGQGMGPGMMGGAQMNDPSFTVDQRKQFARIQTDLRKQHWALHGKMIDAQGKLAELYAEDTPDPKRIGAAYGELFDLRRQMIEAAITAQNRQRDVLTAEQRKQLREKGYGSGRGHGMGMGMMHHGFGHHMMGG